MTNRAARLASSSVPEARRAFVGSACVLAAAALWASPALAGQAPSAEPLGSPGVAPASPGAAPPSQGKAPAPPAQPSPPEASEKRRRIERATALHDEAQGLYQNGEYRAAIAKLEAAVDLDPEGKELVYNLAVIHERLGEIDRAEHYYHRYLEMEALPKEREQVTAVLKRLQGAKRELADAKVQAAAPPPAAPLPLPVLPRVRLLPRRSVVSGNPRPPTPWLFVSGGIAAGSLAVGGVFAALAVARDPGPGERTGGGVTIADLHADARAAHRCAVVADVALVIAGLSGAAALYLYLSPRAPASAGAARAVSSPRALATSPGRDGALTPRGLGAGEGASAVSLSLGAEGARLRVQF